MGLDGLGIKRGLKGLCAERGVDVSRCLSTFPTRCGRRRRPTAAGKTETATRGAGAPLHRERGPVRRAHLFQEKDGGRASRRNVVTSKFPLGEISPACIRARVRRAVRRLGGARPASPWRPTTSSARDAQAIQTATNDFLRAIPHQVPTRRHGGFVASTRWRPYVKTDLVSTLEQILKRLQLDRAAPKQAISEALGDVLRRQYAVLKCDLTTQWARDAAYAAIAGYLRRGWAECTLEAIFEATLAGQTEAFEPHRKSNVHLLWHGSSLSNWAGILSGGLRIAPPEAPVNGYNFDKGCISPTSARNQLNIAASTRARPPYCASRRSRFEVRLKTRPGPHVFRTTRGACRARTVWWPWACGPRPVGGYERSRRFHATARPSDRLRAARGSGPDMGHTVTSVRRGVPGLGPGRRVPRCLRICGAIGKV